MARPVARSKARPVTRSKAPPVAPPVALRAAFIFLAPGADGAKHRATVRTPQVELTVVGVADYAAAERTAQSLVAQGIAAIELCGGFGVAGTARIAAAVAGRAAVGAVRFDAHPGLHWKSGDEVFAA